MTRYMDEYFAAAQEQLATVTRTQRAQLDQAAQWVCDTLIGEHFIYAFGTGHSHMLAEEIFYRAGGLARACPILDERLMLHKEAIQATYLEREERYAKKLLDQYPVESGDVLIVTSNSGRNAVPIEMA